MLNVPTVFMTAGILGWPMALGRIVATFAIALSVGGVLSHWQRRHRNPRKFLRLHILPRLLLLEEGGLVERSPKGLWKLAEAEASEIQAVGACAVLPSGSRCCYRPV